MHAASNVRPPPLQRRERTQACPFCSRVLSRSDALKRHISKCSQRGTKPVPDLNLSRGRIRHSCDRCVAKKLHCDGHIPCRSCAKKSATCTRIGSTERHVDSQVENVVDKCSVAFLLSDDFQSTFSKFNFPLPVGSSMLQDEQETANDNHDSQALVNFMTDIFDFASFSPYPNWLDHVTEFNIADLEQDFGVPDAGQQLQILADEIESLSELEELKLRQQQQIFQDIRHTLSPFRVVRSIAQYFEYWHPNCRIVHRPSFKTNQVSRPLLLSMILLGALYDPDESERTRVSAIAEFLASYVFSHYPQTDPHDENPLDEWEAVQLVQAGFLVVVSQFWTGDTASRQKAATDRFTSVVKFAQTVELFQAHHTHVKREEQWIYQETRIRTATWIILLDCGLLFFKGLPTRVPILKIACQLPCNEAKFDSPDLDENNGLCGPENSIQDVLNSLFDNRDELEIPITLLDSFTMIHLIYRLVNDELISGAWRHMIPTLNGIKSKRLTCLLDKWHVVWARLKQSAIANDEWSALGFWKNGDQYELAIRQLLSESALPEIENLLAYNVDRLELLKTAFWKK